MSLMMTERFPPASRGLYKWVMATTDDNPYVSRGGLKLAAALDEFTLDVTAFTCVDLGCNVGGFTDCLLQRGAAKVYAVDTGYGALAWKLRQDERVVVMERSNGMHCEVPVEVGGAGSGGASVAKPQAAVDLAVIDMGWTKQKHAIPAAMRWGARAIVTLIKPHYEADVRPHQGILDDDEAEQIAQRVGDEMPSLGAELIGLMRSPIRGGKGKNKAGNSEWLALVKPLQMR